MALCRPADNHIFLSEPFSEEPASHVLDVHDEDTTSIDNTATALSASYQWSDTTGRAQ